MDKKEAKQIIRTKLEEFRCKPYSELIEMIEAEPVVGECAGESGKQYQFEVQAFWDDKSGGDVRVLGSIDDGGLSTYLPLTDNFIKNQSGEFVGE